jgi:hypothetical protein
MEKRLQSFIDDKNVPNILIYGSETSNKDEVLTNFLNMLYNDCNRIDKILDINCAEVNQGGIKFIRNDLKFFGKTMIHNEINKTVILRNADKLTHDAQSALRRCIEIYSKNTRFIIIVEDKDKLLNPILSRFCTIFIKDVHLGKSHVFKNNYFQSTLKHLLQKKKDITQLEILDFVDNLYTKGIHIFYLTTYLEKYKDINIVYKYKLLCFIDLARQYIYNDKIITYMFLYYFIMRCEIKIENLMFN